ncbi:hypothetical protein [Pseudoalteromonas phage PH357]|nr:hypothetical protein [Pseudoalteromonas phage PH357]
MKLKRIYPSDRYFTQGNEYTVKDRYIEVERCSIRKFGGGAKNWEERHIKLIVEDDNGNDFELGQYSYEGGDYFYGKSFWQMWEITDKSTEGLTFKGNLSAGKSDHFWEKYDGSVCGVVTILVSVFLVFLMTLTKS